MLPPLFALVHQLPPHLEIRSTSFRLIGRYSKWMGAHPDVLAPCLEFVIQNGLMPRPGAARE